MPNTDPVFLMGVEEIPITPAEGIDLAFGDNAAFETLETLTATPVAEETLFFGRDQFLPTTVQHQNKITFDEDGVLTVPSVIAAIGTPGTDEAWSMYIRVNGTTDYLIEEVESDAAEITWINSDLEITLTKQDTIEFVSVNPDWATPPEDVVFTAQYFFKTKL